MQYPIQAQQLQAGVPTPPVGMPRLSTQRQQGPVNLSSSFPPVYQPGMGRCKSKPARGPAKGSSHCISRAQELCLLRLAEASSFGLLSFAPPGHCIGSSSFLDALYAGLVCDEAKVQADSEAAPGDAGVVRPVSVQTTCSARRREARCQSKGGPLVSHPDSPFPDHSKHSLHSQGCLAGRLECSFVVACRAYPGHEHCFMATIRNYCVQWQLGEIM